MNFLLIVNQIVTCFRMSLMSLIFVRFMFFVLCQKDNVSNQREHIVHLLANEQSRLRIPEETEPVSLTSIFHVN